LIDLRIHRDLARAISAVENGLVDRAGALAQLRAGGRVNGTVRHAHVVGITGPPGAGKSTLVDRIVEQMRADGRTVAVIAVDPSSPFTGGAVLGDRVRMQRHSGDTGVYIRSMASRMAGGGLAPATHDAVLLAEAAGFDIVIVETVGVGQIELEVVGVADLVVVVTVPALGDGVQTIKAGMMEIADLFVVNMADRPGANRTAIDLVHMVREGPRDLPVLQTVANDGTGVSELVKAIDDALSSNESNAVRAARFEVIRRVRDTATARAHALLGNPAATALFDRLLAREATRAATVDALLDLITDDARASASR
jgi:LAO/AO transport system kinase